MIRLWRKNSLGLGTWKIWSDGSRIYYAHSTTEGGAEITHFEEVQINQSGRSLEQQIELQMQSRVSRQLDKGYKHLREDALLGSTNQLGLINPMLAQPLERLRLSNSEGGYVQRKYDGHRCLITKRDGEIVAYTRKGKLIDTINHIAGVAATSLPEGVTLDGELYIHGVPLQTISSIIKRTQPDNAKLKYHWYDIVLPCNFEERYSEMLQLAQTLSQGPIELVETIRVSSLADALLHFKQFRGEGYEGAIFRRSLRGYEDSKRSDQLVKLKERSDTEVTVLSVSPSKDGWGVCRVKTDWGPEFDIAAPGTFEEKSTVLRESGRFIGKRLTIEYAYLTADKIPFHAVALRWRDDL